MELYFVTSNENKIKEAESILSFKIDNISIDVDEIQAIEVSDVIKHKAKAAFHETNKPVMVEDTGLYIRSWKGFPGALIKWVMKTLGNEGLCEALGENREATAKTSICLYNGKSLEVFDGEIRGLISETPRGENGFGWDPIFQPEGHERTFAEMDQVEKDSMSMRKRALDKVHSFLEDNPDFLD